jgi:hypothetical protein
MWAIFILKLVIRRLVIGRRRKVRIFIVDFPAVGFVEVLQFAFHILEYFILQRCELLLPEEHRIIAGQEHIEADKLPLGDTFGFLDVREWVAGEGLSAVWCGMKKLAIFTLNHL